MVIIYTLLIIALTLLALAGLVYAYQIISKGVLKAAEDLKSIINQLLQLGFDRGTLVIQEKNSGKFIQFRKYIDNNGSSGLELGFPNANWSEKYFGDAIQYFEENKVPYLVRREGIDGMEFLLVNLEQNVDKAYKVCCDLFELMDVSLENKFHIMMNNVSV